MTVTINLPQNVEQAYLNAARTKGVSVDALVADVLVSHVPVAESAQRPELVEEPAYRCFAPVIPVLRTGYPLGVSIVNDTLEAVRRERDSSVLGQG